MLAAPLDETGDRDIVRFVRLDLKPTFPLAQDKSFVAESQGAVELVEDLTGTGIQERAEIEPRIEPIKAIEMFLANGRGVGFRQPGAGGDDGVAEGVNEKLAVARLPGLPRGEVVKRLVRAALPAKIVVSDGADAVDLESDLPFASQCLAIPG
jgi:hypothetical protein